MQQNVQLDTRHALDFRGAARTWAIIIQLLKQLVHTMLLLWSLAGDASDKLTFKLLYSAAGAGSTVLHVLCRVTT